MKFASRTALPVFVSTRRSSPVASVRRPRVIAASPAHASRALAVGKSFGRKRIGHAVEVAGTGIMLALFLILALLA